MTAGSRSGEVYEERDAGRLKRLYTQDGVLTGFILVGNVERAGIYTSLIRNQTPLDTIDFEILKKVPNLFSFDVEYRRKKLGSVV